MAATIEIELYRLGALQLFDALQHGLAIAFTPHPLHRFGKAVLIEHKGIGIAFVMNTDNPDALLEIQ